MSGRHRKAARWLCGGLVVLALALCAAAWALLSTQPGLRFTWALVERRLPATVRVEDVSGRLRGPLTLAGLHVEGGGAGILVSTIQVDWNILSLLRRTLDVRRLEIDTVRITLRESLPHESAGRQASLPSITLPIEVTIRRGFVRDIEIVSAAQPTHTAVDSVVVRELSFRDTLDFRELTVDSPLGRIGVSGRVSPQGSYPFALESSWEIATSRIGPVTGRLDADGDVERLTFTAEVSRPLGARATGSLTDPIGLPVIDARITIDETDFRVLAPDGPEGRAGGVVDVAGVIDSLDVVGSAMVATPVAGTAEIEASVTLRADRVLVDRLKAQIGSTSLTADGTVLLTEDGPDLDLALAWTGLRWPMQDEARVHSDSGSGRLLGRAADYRVTADARVAGDGLPPSRIRLRGSGSTERMSVDELHLDALSGELTARGQVAWAPEIRWNLELSGRDMESMEILPDSSRWQGRMSFEGRARGRMSASLVEVDMTLDTVRGEVNDAPLDASGSGFLTLPLEESGPNWDNAGLSMRWLEVEWGPNRAFVSGSITDSVDLGASIALRDLGVIMPGLSGTLEGWSHLGGSRALPEAEIDFSALEVATGSVRIERAFASGLVQTAPGGIVDVELVASDVTSGNRRLDSIRARVRGGPGAHDLIARVGGEEMQVELAASGGVSERRWAGTLARLDVEGGPMGAWQLAAPVAASVSAGAAEIERACWRSEPARLCLQGGWEADGLTSLALSVVNLPGSALTGSLPVGWSLVGALQAEALVTIQASGALTAQADIDLGSGRIRYSTSRGPRELGYSTASAEVGVTDEGARATFGTTLIDDAGRDVVVVAGDLALPDYTQLTDTLRAQPVRGSLAATVGDFSPFEFLMAGIVPLDGNLQADVAVSGSVERPEFVGEARLRDGSADVPRLGLELRALELTARGRGLEGITLEGGLRSGGGTLTVSGELPAAPSQSQPATFRVTGARVQAVALPEVSVAVSPDLQIVASPERLGIGGALGVPVARVELSEIPATAVRPSRDVVFVGDTAAAVRAMPNLELAVRVVLGDSVSFQGFGFSARPTGTLLAADGPGGTTTATGEITLNDGRYRAYGQDLTIERGRILFAGGPVENPGLDIRATRTAQDGVIAGLQVAGTLNTPEVTIFSEPTMAESEALAYIVLGHPLGTASASEGNRVANAAASLGLREGNVLANRIGQRFGLAEMRVEAEGPLEEASLVAGKYLSPRLYVSYGVGLFEPISTFRLRYMLSGRWTLRAESGRATGADLLYRLERGS